MRHHDYEEINNQTPLDSLRKGIECTLIISQSYVAHKVKAVLLHPMPLLGKLCVGMCPPSLDANVKENLVRLFF